MLGLDTELKQTRFYQEIAEEERLEGRLEGRLEARKEQAIVILTRQLRCKFGLQPELEAALQRLPNMELEQLEDLAEELLDFKVVGDLQAWIHTDNP